MTPRRGRAILTEKFLSKEFTCGLSQFKFQNIFRNGYDTIGERVVALFTEGRYRFEFLEVFDSPRVSKKQRTVGNAVRFAGQEVACR